MTSPGPKHLSLKLLLLLSYSIIIIVNPFSAFAFTGPNIVLIVVDTLRADHVSAYGYSRKTTPFIDSLAARGTVYTKAYAPSSWTVPSIVSLFTGYYPFHHGVIHSIFNRDMIISYESVPEQYTTLAERFKEAGYLTIGISANRLLSKQYGFAQGFDYFACRNYLDASETNGLFEYILGKIKGKVTPFFLWVHYFDPHFSYKLQKPWIHEYFPLSRYLILPAVNEEIQKDVRNRPLVVAAYDSEINYVDKYVKRLLSGLPAKNTIVVITSDHGEEFKEHGWWGHGNNLFNESIRIPLIITRLGLPHSRINITQPVSLLDLYPTLLNLADISVPEGLDGKILPDKPTPGDKPGDRIIYSELSQRHYFRAKVRARKTLLKGRYKIIRNLATGKEKLFDLASDPGETENLFPKGGEIQQQMHTLMESWISRGKKEGPLFKTHLKHVKTDQETIERLRSLGYLQ